MSSQDNNCWELNTVAAAELAYDYDDIGNRETSSERGTNTLYAANNLNQYTSITNISTSQLSNIPTFQPVFDADGNQTLIKTATGTWQVTYNGENRPVRWERVSSGSNTLNPNTQTLLLMSFDRMGRRVTKNDQRFVYNGYLQIADNAGNTYVWDVAEPVATRPLAWNFSTSQPSTSQPLFYTHDGNKNVSEVVSSNDDLAARYEYAAFGAVTQMSGALAAANPWRFSSEYAEDDTATVYYNYRHYESVMGRWLGRDPAEEGGGFGLYGFCANSNHSFDVLGLWLGPSHRKFTDGAFNAVKNFVFSDRKDTCFRQYNLDKIRDALSSANTATDQGAMAKDQGYHYCRWTENLQTEEYWRKRYGEHMGDAEKVFTDSLESKQPRCQIALEKLGLLSHMWQDYYAHGVEKDDSWFGAKPGLIKGSPDHPLMIPVTYGAGGFNGGHGGAFRFGNPFSRLEPGDRASDSVNRHILSMLFTFDRFLVMLPRWAEACKCDEAWTVNRR